MIGKLGAAISAFKAANGWMAAASMVTAAAVTISGGVYAVGQQAPLLPSSVGVSHVDSPSALAPSADSAASQPSVTSVPGAPWAGATTEAAEAPEAARASGPADPAASTDPAWEGDSSTHPDDTGAVPDGSEGSTPGGAPKRPARVQADCSLGGHQLEVESYLSWIGTFGPVSVDGKQSAQDCAAIKRFQQRFGINPANGRAGPTTAYVGWRIYYSGTPAAKAGCRPPATGLIVCIDLTLQTTWIVNNGTVVWGPTVTRTGMRGFRTPAGTYRIYRRNVREWSNPYHVWLPYWQAFNGGMGFHQTTTYIHNSPIGSHGCVNLLKIDVVAMWGTARVGATVRIFGRRAGT